MIWLTPSNKLMPVYYILPFTNLRHLVEFRFVFDVPDVLSTGPTVTPCNQITLKKKKKKKTHPFYEKIVPLCLFFFLIQISEN